MLFYKKFYLTEAKITLLSEPSKKKPHFMFFVETRPILSTQTRSQPLFLPPSTGLSAFHWNDIGIPMKCRCLFSAKPTPFQWKAERLKFCKKNDKSWAFKINALTLHKPHNKRK